MDTDLRRSPTLVNRLRAGLVSLAEVRVMAFVGDEEARRVVVPMCYRPNQEWCNLPGKDCWLTWRRTICPDAEWLGHLRDLVTDCPDPQRLGVVVAVAAREAARLTDVRPAICAALLAELRNGH